VVLSGGAGVGKSALALRAANQVKGRFADGQLYVDLRTTGTAAAALAGFLRALGIAAAAVPDDVHERSALYRSLLSDRRTLVMLDNVSGYDQVGPLLPGTANCAVIVTGRHRLTGIPGAYQLGLRPFETGEGVALVRRIVGPARNESEPSAVRELVQLCGSLPLAIRAACCRLTAGDFCSAGELVVRLRDERHRLDELSRGGLGVRTSIELGYQGLPERTQRLFRRLGILRCADFPDWMAVAALDDGDPYAADQALNELVDASLLEVAGRDDAGELRYRFNDLVRLYAADRLHATDDLAELPAWLGWLPELSAGVAR
jgi:hypothetical protein